MSAVTCLPCIHIKHATLINNCYPPVKEEKSMPHSSEQSYLLFYASSRPQKLTKVGSFLQKKVARDIRKGRKSHNLVSLHIIKALIQTCHRDLNLFSKYIIAIFSMLLDTRDLDIIDLTCENFIVFCSYHDGSTLAVDTQFRAEYETLLEKFAGFCTYDNNDTLFTLKMQYIGHRATQAAITSSALESSDFETQLDILFPPLIVTLGSDPKKAVISTSGIDIRVSVFDLPQIDKQLIESLAAYTISLLFSKLIGPFVRYSLKPLFKYLSETQAWSSPEFAVNMLKLILDSLQPQYRYILVSEIMAHIDQQGQDDLTEKHAALVCILDTMLNADVSLIGISVLEVQNSLFHLLFRTTPHHPFNPNTTKKDHATIIQHGLVHSMGGLASHVYYDNQLSDMVGYLIPKLKSNTSLEQVEGMSLQEYRTIVLSCLYSVVQGAKKNRKTADTSTAWAGSSEVEQETEALYLPEGIQAPLDVWTPGLSLLHDKDPKTRIQFGRVLYAFLDAIPSNLSAESTHKYPSGPLNHLSTAAFLNKLSYSFMDWILLPDFNLSDLKALYALLCIANCKFGMDATVLLVPLVFRVQTLIQQDKITDKARQEGLLSAMVCWLDQMAQFYDIQPMINYLHPIQTSMHPFDLTNSFSAFTEAIEDFHPVESNSVTWVDRNKIVELMSNEGQLRDETDTHGLELEAKLFAEWDSDAFLQRTQYKRIQITPEADEHKLKLASPWEHVENKLSFPFSEKSNHSIRVTNLKEALVGQLVADDETDSSQSNSVPSSRSAKATSPPIVKRTTADLNALLNELSLPHDQSAQSNISLVNPPYASS
ncbi:hypothetical protein BD560DRAFT_386912 [Blakeslea trispora]|nr:hypothetical protein BD560DRAFT_386912 [Blakeslea trispora]